MANNTLQIHKDTIEQIKKFNAENNKRYQATIKSQKNGKFGLRK